MENKGLELLQLRKKLGLKQEEFAKLIGVSRHSVINYEKTGNISELKMNNIRSIIDKLQKGDSTDFPKTLSEPSAGYSKNQNPEKYAESLERIIESKDEQIKLLREQIAFFKEMLKEK